MNGFTSAEKFCLDVAEYTVLLETLKQHLKQDFNFQGICLPNYRDLLK